MTGIQSFYIAILLLSVVLNSILAVLSFSRSQVPGAQPFAGLMLAGAWWSATNALEAFAWDISVEIWISKIAYFGKEGVPVFFFLFALEYTRLVRPLSKWVLRGLWAIPLLTWIMVLTNDLHGLFWSSIYPMPGAGAGVYVYEHGIWFWLTLTYNYLLILGGTLLLIFFAARVVRLYRRQTVALVAGVLVTWLANGVYLLGFTPTSMDLTPIASALTGLIFAWGILRLRLFDLVPAARSTLIEELDDGVLVLDIEDRVVDLNPAACRFLHAKNDVIGQHAESVFSPWRDLLAACKAQERTEMEILYSGDMERYLNVRMAALRNKGGQLNGRLLVLHDISAQKRLEKLRNDLVHTIVHDLRNPLTNVLVALDTMDRMEGNDRAMVLNVARSSAGKMLEMVNSILDVTRLERGQLELDNGPVNLKSLANGVLQDQAPLATRKEIQLSLEAPDDLPPAWGDATLLRRVLQNLVGNALVHTPPQGTVHVSISENAAERSLVTSVLDSGPGVQPSVEPYLFQMFTSGRGGSKGTGIGLYFCRLTVEAHGGRIWMESSTEQGATFSFSIPISSK
ncbi:MAG: PAS domain-containing protein [Anaerolineales bacterium]|nr:PAS domain-containing protein [Anaerolineales bacterium]